MRTTKVVSISMPAETFAAAQKLAAEELRTMSDLMRTAFWVYQPDLQEWADIFAVGERARKKAGVRNEDVVRIVREVRREIVQQAAKAAVSGTR